MTHAVIVNDRQQYALWPSGTGLPEGWQATGWTGGEQACLDRIAELWKDGRPAPVRRAVAEDAARPAVQLLVTPRLWMREVLPEEAGQITEGGTAGLEWLGGAPSAETRIAAKMLTRAAGAGVHVPGWGMYLLLRTQDARVVGAMGFHGPPSDGSAEIGFDLDGEARGRGYATEALRELAAWSLRQDKVDTVVATTTEDNVASQRVMERAGFELLPERDAEGLFVYRLTR
ncbi:GNAT family N-acetyltransferase [Streptomyces sp. ML-6]|uniref:GNAT family N-acetyltransferase n=1 Tax=Streptomyces sp. ML-6 TaxID=2982693 RepID=UPI0024C02B0C|nr:GNAT family N-acetyltransferase [Streptomyces sp. ML-6]MDK0524635.1 GNAT family N-acetyltransferase [Streptomyces sp. ML-6]